MANIKTTELIKHPEQLSADTVKQLRALLERYPYYQTARLLLLENLYKTHSEEFNTELRRSAVLLADRRVLFDMVEGSNYDIPLQNTAENTETQAEGDRTLSLIDSYLEAIPATETSKHKSGNVDPAQDYAAYLMQMDAEENGNPYIDTDDEEDLVLKPEKETERKPGRIVLADKPENTYEEPETEAPGEEYFTETLAQIYIKQQKYERALEIIQALNLNNPKKNAYFADQIRFLEKLVLINKTKK
jgi:hypothetical protein